MFTPEQKENVYRAAMSLANMAKESGKPLILPFKPYAQFLIGGIQHELPLNVIAWLDDSTIELTEDEKATVRKVTSANEISYERLVEFTEEFNDCLSSNEIQSIGNFVLISEGSSDETDVVCSGGVAYFLELPAVADCKILDI